MTLEIKERYKLNTNVVILAILISCLGTITAIVISMTYGSTLLTSRLPHSSSSEEVTSTTTTPSIDLGNVNGFILNSDGLPVSGASVHAYKHTGLIYSADKNPGYIASITTNSGGAYLFDGLPSGVYKFTVKYPDGDVQTINNYAVWPSSSSSYVFKE